MVNIISLLLVVFTGSYITNRIRRVEKPAHDALKLTGILAGAFVVLGAIVYLSIVLK